MPLEHAFEFPLARGLHARPAASLRERARAFRAECSLLNERNQRRADLRDLLSLLATDTGHGDPCRLLFKGPDEASARDALGAFLAGEFLTAEEEPVPASGCGVGTVIPRLLEDSPARWWTGEGLSPGLGEGDALLLSGLLAPEAAPQPLQDSPESQMEAFTSALLQAEADLSAEALHAGHPTLRAVLEAHRAMIEDRNWRASVAAGIWNRNLTARSSVLAAGQAWAEALEAADHSLLRERAVDVRELTARLIQLLGDPGQAPLPAVDRPFVLVGWDLSLNQLLKLDRTLLRGLVLTECGANSHLSILARTFGIPLVAGIRGLPLLLAPGTPLLVDGSRGLLVADAPGKLRRYYAVESESRAAGQERLRGLARQPARTVDGLLVAVQANLSLAEEAASAFELGAEGIGLFRTEMLFADRATPPGEEEQARIYGTVLETAGDRPVTMRLLDSGGDKPLPCLRLAHEPNPYLGRRAVRWYPDHPELIRTQIRALLRAGAGGGRLRVMVPMVSEPSELAWVRGLLQEEAAALRTPPPPLGAMVEVPAAALNLAALAPLADFFCVGTNDLVQYLFAADRNFPLVARPEQAWHPSTLRVLDAIARAARAARRPLSICGEMASRPELLPLLLGLGYDVLSVAPSAIGELKRRARGLEAAACAGLAARARECLRPEEVLALLEAEGPHRNPSPLVEADLVDLDADCATKEEAIKRLVERVHGTGRTLDPRALEEAIWARERVFATGVGHGIAVPHCQTKVLGCATLAMVRLARGVDWGGPGESPVRTVILLALPGEEAEQEHLRLFARLARRLMDGEFRRRLEGTPDARELLDSLGREVLAVP